MTNDYVVVNAEAQTMPNDRFAEIMAMVLAKGAPFRFQANGFSMSPFIHDGDLITIAPTPTRIRFGDVVAFINPCRDRLTVHRVVHISRIGYLIQGDNSPEPDGCVSRTEIIGCVTRVEHHGKPIRLGLGSERVVIALLSRRGWLVPFLGLMWRVLGPIFKRFNS